MNVGELRKLIAELSDDAPVFLTEAAPASKNPSNFEDEYGPGTMTFNVTCLNEPIHTGTLTFFKAGRAESQAACG